MIDENLKEEDLKEEELKKLKIKVIEEKNKFLRFFAYFENSKKRLKKEKIEFRKNANKTFLLELLPILDDFDRSLKEIKKYKNKPLIKGILLIKEKFLKILTKKGLEKMKTKKGDIFNTDLHEAITQIKASKDSLKGKVISVIEKGYFLNKKVIRYSKVIVGN
ncbi:MAG: nucleotide exchange factor GrpE [Candidatus Karelsulcia muelleri]|nr:MAG: nucleotide exchange factor GrpE [Candidatus Karelsulcia muelleri]